MATAFVTINIITVAVRSEHLGRLLAVNSGDFFLGIRLAGMFIRVISCNRIKVVNNVALA